MENPPPIPVSDSCSVLAKDSRPPIGEGTEPSATNTRRFRVFRRLGVIALIVAVLHVPVLFILDTLHDRKELRDVAVHEMQSVWGAEQRIMGPVLCVPYTITTRASRQVAIGGKDQPIFVEENLEVAGAAFFAPKNLSVSATLDVSERRRGIFGTAVYVAEMTMEGRFEPEVEKLGLEGAKFDWSRARVVLDLPAPRDLRAAPLWKQGGAEVEFEPAATRYGGWGGVEAALAPAQDREAASVPFSLQLSIQGSRRVSFVPMGETNSVTLAGKWPDPSFDGAQLPIERTVGPEGFSARWGTTRFGRRVPESWVEQPGRPGPEVGCMRNSAMGVTLATPVDAYRMVERALKYVLLVLTLVFAVFFIFEIVAGLSVHPLQYLMVGGALVLFYLGFLALAEFVSSGAAYGIAAGASTVLVGGYSRSVLQAGRRWLLIVAGLSGTYGYIYFLLSLQDYALLAGVAALFTLLGAAMWCTRRVDWLALESGAARPAGRGA